MAAERLASGVVLEDISYFFGSRCTMTEFQESIDIQWGFVAIIELLRKGKFHTVLDIGAGEGKHTAIFRQAGKKVLSIDKFSSSVDIKLSIYEYETEQQFDCIFCSHVIEHESNTGFFLQRIRSLLKDNGILCIIGPCHSADSLVEGHLKTWTAALALQNLTLNGFDCRNSFIYQFNETGVICQKSNNYDPATPSGYPNGHLWPECLPVTGKLTNKTGYYLGEPTDIEYFFGKKNDPEIIEVKVNSVDNLSKPFKVKCSRFWGDEYQFS